MKKRISLSVYNTLYPNLSTSRISSNFRHSYATRYPGVNESVGGDDRWHLHTYTSLLCDFKRIAKHINGLKETNCYNGWMAR